MGLFYALPSLKKADSHLEDRSKLVFNFPSEDPGDVPRVLHFMENMNITESTKAKYSEYNPIGRNGSVFVYIGAESRSLTLDFNMTLANIMQFGRYKPNNDGSNFESKYAIRQEYFSQYSQEEGGPTPDLNESLESPLKMIDAFDKVWLKLLDEEELRTIFFKLGVQNAQGLLVSNDKGQVINTRRVALASVLWWINLIRASVMTSSRNPYLGPPIVRLHHGVLYQNVPCVVTDVNIRIVGDDGMDQRTLIPNTFKVTMNLKEVRLSGKAGEYNAANPGAGDIQPGWDSLFNGGATLDPVDFATLTTDFDFNVGGTLDFGQQSEPLGSNSGGTGSDANPPATAETITVSW